MEDRINWLEQLVDVAKNYIEKLERKIKVLRKEKDDLLDYRDNLFKEIRDLKRERDSLKIENSSLKDHLKIKERRISKQEVLLDFYKKQANSSDKKKSSINWDSKTSRIEDNPDWKILEEIKEEIKKEELKEQKSKSKIDELFNELKCRTWYA